MIEPGRSSPGIVGTRKLPSEQATAPRLFLFEISAFEGPANIDSMGRALCLCRGQGPANCCTDYPAHKLGTHAVHDLCIQASGPFSRRILELRDQACMTQPQSRQVTSILPNPRKPGRFDVEIDGMPTATVSIEAMERFALGVGALIDERTATAIEREVAILHTYDRALNMLAARGRSSVELRRLLVRKGEPADSVDIAIERLVSVGFLDDAAFARQFARSKGVSGGLSRRRLQQELGRRGVSRETGTEAIETVFVEEAVDEEAAIERVARKKLRSLSSLDDATKRRRLYSFLARRGYDSDDIGRVTRQLLESRESEDDV